MITKKFIEKVHIAFDELNYRQTEQLNKDEFEKAATHTLIHCKDLIDAKYAVHFYQFCLKYWKKIEKIFAKKLTLFNGHNYEGNSLISIVSDDEAYGTYYITNGINRKINEIFVASCSLDEEIFTMGVNKEFFTIFDDGEYYLKHSNLSSDKMKLYNQQKECLCNIVLSKSNMIYLENNTTNYYLVDYDDFIGIYDRKYIESLSDNDTISTDKLLADIEWDILKKNSDFGVAKLNVYAEGQDLEMFLMFATSTFLAFQRYMRAVKATILMFNS